MERLKTNLVALARFFERPANRHVTRLGVPIVLTPGNRGPAGHFQWVTLNAACAKARKEAKLGAHLTLDACRQGGLIEPGDRFYRAGGDGVVDAQNAPGAQPLHQAHGDATVAAARQRRAHVAAKAG
jgi:hypothetical protein